ncbi:DUF4124 domain-containing protein [Parashewanella tropica]|uniref:DUF4124 domain-containing protein n=1 Tax=Parashewanella tropica TaxID=2547970 RepID=UPI0014788A42|nr:DUF4124 domain-containing protein [Parashewanella tropica]
MRNGLVLCLLLLSLPAMAAVYKWIDKDGKVHYSDKPRPGAVEVKPSVRVLNEMSSSVITPKTHGSTETQDKAITATVSIVSPQDQQTIRDNNGQFEVVAVAQGTSDNFMWQLMVDGQPYGDFQLNGRFQLNNLDRGEHQLQVIASPRGSDKQISSDKITIYLHRHSKNFPNSPLIRKKP